MPGPCETMVLIDSSASRTYVPAAYSYHRTLSHLSFYQATFRFTKLMFGTVWKHMVCYRGII